MRDIAATFFAASLLCAAAFAQPGPQAAGHWEGKIQIPEHELNVSVDLDRNPQGAWIGSMTVTGSTSVDVPLTTVSVDGASVKFTAYLPKPATFQGKLSEDARTLAGTAVNDSGEAPFQLTRSGDAKVKLPPPSSALSKEFDGLWQGALNVNGNVLHVGMKFAAGADGKATATLISYDQGNLEIPADTVTINGKDLDVNVRAISGNYKGTLGASGEIAGQWTQGPGTLPLTLKRPSAAPKP